MYPDPIPKLDPDLNQDHDPDPSKNTLCRISFLIILYRKKPTPYSPERFYWLGNKWTHIRIRFPCKEITGVRIYERQSMRSVASTKHEILPKMFTTISK